MLSQQPRGYSAWEESKGQAHSVMVQFQHAEGWLSAEPVGGLLSLNPLDLQCGQGSLQCSQHLSHWWYWQ